MVPTVRKRLEELGFVLDGDTWKHPTLGWVNDGIGSKGFRYHERRMRKWLGLREGDAPEVVEHAFGQARLLARNWGSQLGGTGAVLTPHEVRAIERRIVILTAEKRAIVRAMRAPEVSA